MDTVLKVALGVFVGALIVFLFRIAYVNYVFNKAMTSVAEVNETIANQTQKRLQIQKDKITAERAATRREERAMLAAAEQKRLEAAKKAKAWANFFKDPEECLSYKSEQHMIECANRRIKAKREFEQKWNEGSL
ncbi:hypothetical protein [Arenicella xantha]|uniref:Uncharacterized protein n=1 Tax=Arenicella xantha TaxID=644221 RepID=A0A395JJK4_9GAMM|nr:hypothetical protein [Arenicella xantha]RBP48948.1 hypothetical protein DFR28_105288 [Arenicella xantha]